MKNRFYFLARLSPGEKRVVVWADLQTLENLNSP
jgi:hypothetical protein